MASSELLAPAASLAETSVVPWHESTQSSPFETLTQSASDSHVVSTSSTSSAKHIASAHSRLHPAGPVVVPCGGSADASKHCNSIPNVASASPTSAASPALR